MENRFGFISKVYNNRDWWNGTKPKKEIYTCFLL